MNPELRKNIWLELTPGRLMTMPFVLFLIFSICYISDLERPERAFKAMVTTATVVYFLICLAWGSKLAAESMTDEVNQNTWDFQRMSSMNAWDMTWGKLLGSTIYPWYGGVMCILVSIIASSILDYSYIPETVFFMIISAIVAHTIAFLISVRGVIKRNGVGRVFSGVAILCGVVTGGFIHSLMSEENLLRMQNVVVQWYGFEFGNFMFLAISILVFQAWFLIGAYRLMRVELQFQSTPTVWISFLLFQMFYFSGFHFTKANASQFSAIGAALTISMYIGVLWTYAMLSSEIKSAVTFRKIFRLYGLKDWRRFYIQIPRWVLTYLITVLVGLLAIFFVPNLSMFDAKSYTAVPTAFILSTLLFLLRDIGIILYFSLFKNSTRADRSVFITFFVLYGLLPGMFSGLFGRDSMPLFYPFSISNNIIYIVMAPAIQVIFTLIMLRGKWRISVKEIDSNAIAANS